jgi:hypothetical protein
LVVELVDTSAQPDPTAKAKYAVLQVQVLLNGFFLQQKTALFAREHGVV